MLGFQASLEFSVAVTGTGYLGFNSNNINGTIFFGILQGFLVLRPSLSKAQGTFFLHNGVQLSQTVIIHKPIIGRNIAAHITTDAFKLFMDYPEH